MCFRILIIFSILLSFANAYSYEVEFQDERIFTKCDDKPDNFLDSAITFDDLVFETLDNNSIHISGDIKLTTKYPYPLKGTATIFKRQNGQWVDTIYNLKRNDFCTALFSPTEFWSGYTKNFEPEKRKCPFPDGYAVHLDFLSDVIINNIPDKKVDGEYKLIGKLFTEVDPDFLICFNIYMNVVRI